MSKTTVSEKAGRASPLSVEDRQDMILDAITPLLLEHGQAVTTRQIAECAGIAEGTIFRAFGTKEELINAAVERRLDPEPFRAGLREVDLDMPLEERIRTIVALLQERFTLVFNLMMALGRRGGPPPQEERREFGEIMARALAPDLERLSVSPERAAQVIRMVTLAASVPHLNDAEISTDEITSIILYGIAGRPAETTISVSTDSPTN
ncbi:TetR/AcrR family transcriptional regulator [Glaciibacter superstes]|uniref:TetR/AcrR family transcriptional regulator n=1 Tax=Glaciibacter superstes TaxID=501023 RepID=UPI0003B69400|nr:TetR/AcrR family transcriptional regulator [Glaciibacter superstes]